MSYKGVVQENNVRCVNLVEEGYKYVFNQLDSAWHFNLPVCLDYETGSQNTMERCFASLDVVLPVDYVVLTLFCVCGLVGTT